jgi:hypothetical protein
VKFAAREIGDFTREDLMFWHGQAMRVSKKD